jgi:hypothetical protein
MTEANRRATISRREAIRLFAVTSVLVTGGMLVNPLCGEARAMTSTRRAVTAHAQKGLADMTLDLAQLAAEHFEPLVGETFTIGQYQLTLRDVYRRHKIGSRFREQFALVFTVPHELPMRSELLPVAHPAIGRHDLLVTQIIDHIDGTALEICFS